MGAKYQKGLDKTKEFLKSHSAITIREVCDKAEIEPKDADILISRFNKRRGRLHVSYDRGQCESLLSINTTRLLTILKDALVKLGLIDDNL